VSSAACAPRPDSPWRDPQRPPILGWTLRRLRLVASPPRPGALLRLFARLELLRHHKAQLKALVKRARRFTPQVSDVVAALAHSDPDTALETFVSAFQSEYFELDESICDGGFEFWADAADEFIPLVLRGTDRCNGLEPTGFRPGYTLQWALIEDIFDGDERSQVIAEVADTFGNHLADRLEGSTPPAHHTLRRRLARSPYVGMVAFGCWALGDAAPVLGRSLNELLFHHAHHAEEVRICWTRSGVARAARLIREADDFEAPMLALARWLEHAPAEHGRLLVDAVLGREDARVWNTAAMQPCHLCGFPPLVRTREEALSRLLLPDPSPHLATRAGRVARTPALPEVENCDDPDF